MPVVLTMTESVSIKGSVERTAASCYCGKPMLMGSCALKNPLC